VKQVVKAVERTGRRRLAGLLQAMLPRATCTDLPDPPSSVLVVRPDSRLGNLVLLEPLLRSLRDRFPGCRIAVLTSDRFSPVLSSQGYETIPVPKALYARKPWLFPAFAAELRRMSFEVAIDASHPRSFSLSGAAAAALTGAPARIGFGTDRAENWYSHRLPVPSADRHESAALHSLGSVWSNWPAWAPPRLEVRSCRPRQAVGLHVGASRGKAYPPERMKELLAGLAGRVPVEIYWGGAAEKSLAESIEVPGAALMPSMDTKGLMEELAGLRVLVTADNGPMHVASALGVPVVALFRMVDSGRFGPLSRGSRVLFDPSGPDPALAVEAVLEAFSG
jgi:ADP-heptose:LPS heptosyltransferase